MHLILMILGVLFLVHLFLGNGGQGIIALYNVAVIFCVLTFYAVLGLVLLWAVAYAIMHVIF